MVGGNGLSAPSFSSSFSSKNVLIVVAVLAFVAIGAYYIYFYMGPGAKKASYKPNEAFESSDSKEAKIILFHVDWCPHCKTAKPEWDAVKSKYNETSKNGYKIIFVEYNCTNENAETERLIKQYKVEGYPTIKLVKDGKVTDFDAKPTQNSLSQLIETSI